MSNDFATRYEADYQQRKEKRGRSPYATETLARRRIERYSHKKAIYDRHLAGETYVAIARDLGVPTHNVKRHSHEWRTTLESYPTYLQQRERVRASERDRLDRFYQPLIAAGLLE